MEYNTNENQIKVPTMEQIRPNMNTESKTKTNQQTKKEIKLQQYVEEKIHAIPTNNITVMQTPETDEAEMLLSEAEERFKTWLTIPSIIFAICGFFAIAMSNISYTALVVFTTLTVASLIAILIINSIKNKYLAPYKKLLDIAKLNDKVRHEERIRFRERKRLEKEEN